MSITLAPDFTQQLLDAVEQGPSWLEATRRAAMAEFTRLGFPNTRNEDWHYTNPSAIAEGGFQLVPAGAANTVTAADLAAFTFGQDAWPLLVFVNGRFSAPLSRLGALPAGVRVATLTDAMRDDRAFLEARLANVARFDEHAFTALNTAFMTEGAVIHVARDTEVALPIHLLFIADEGAEGGIVHPRVIVAAERGSKATVVESWVAKGTPRYVSNVVTEVDVAEGATVTHLKIQR